jgi:hypothetical protein
MIQYGYKDFIIMVQLLQHLSAEGSAAFSLSVVMPGPAFFTAELLVGPAVSDPVSALKADRHMSYMTFIIHRSDH